MKYIKINLLIIFGIFSILLLTVGCGEDEGQVLPYTESENDISFPDYPNNTVTFTSLDRVIVNVSVDGPASSLDVSSGGQSFGTVNLSGGTGTFDASLEDLGISAGESILLEFSADEGGSTVKRLFSVNIGE